MIGTSLGQDQNTPCAQGDGAVGYDHRRSHMKAGGGSCLLLDFPVFASSCPNSIAIQICMQFTYLLHCSSECCTVRRILFPDTQTQFSFPVTNA